jgi:hypothetical protein
MRIPHFLGNLIDKTYEAGIELREHSPADVTGERGVDWRYSMRASNLLQ